MNREDRIQGGLDVILRDARYGKPKTWTRHKRLVDQARMHIIACGGDPDDYLPQLKRQLQEVMRL